MQEIDIRAGTPASNPYLPSLLTCGETPTTVAPLMRYKKYLRGHCWLFHTADSKAAHLLLLLLNNLHILFVKNCSGNESCNTVCFNINIHIFSFFLSCSKMCFNVCLSSVYFLSFYSIYPFFPLFSNSSLVPKYI